MSNQDPYHPFLHCPNCKKRKLRKLMIRMARGKNKPGLKCDGCSHDLTNYKGSLEEKKV